MSMHGLDGRASGDHAHAEEVVRSAVIEYSATGSPARARAAVVCALLRVEHPAARAVFLKDLLEQALAYCELRYSEGVSSHPVSQFDDALFARLIANPSPWERNVLWLLRSYVIKDYETLCMAMNAMHSGSRSAREVPAMVDVVAYLACLGTFMSLDARGALG